MRDDEEMTDANTARSDSRHVSVWIDTSPARAYSYVCDPKNLTDWAAGLAHGEVRHIDGEWVVSSPMGEVRIEFAPENSFGVVDHSVRSADGQAFYNPMRIVPDGESENRCEVIFTVRRLPGASDDDFASDVAAVTADLRRLREVLLGQ